MYVSYVFESQKFSFAVLRARMACFFLPVVFEHGKHGRIGGIRTKINETKGFLDLNFITSLVDVGVIFDMSKSMHDSHGQSEG